MNAEELQQFLKKTRSKLQLQGRFNRVEIAALMLIFESLFAQRHKYAASAAANRYARFEFA